MLPQQLHTTFGRQRDYDKENNPKQGRRPPAHLKDHLWDSLDGWVDAEAQAARNRLTAEKHIQEGIPQIFPANQKRRGISAAVRGGCSGNANEPFNHVPGEDPSKWEKAHHFKRFASRPEMIHDSVWACTGYANEGLPDALAKLLPSHSSIRNNLRTAARDQLVADGAMPPALPRYRKLWAFQKRELSLSKQLTVPPRPPQTLSEKYPDYVVIENPSSTMTKMRMIPQPPPINNNLSTSAQTQQFPRDSCIAGCCTTCGTNLKPWMNGMPMNIYGRAQTPSNVANDGSRNNRHVSQYVAEKKKRRETENHQEANSHHHHVITLPRSVIVSGGQDFGSPKKWQTTNNRVFNTRAASAGNQRKQRAIGAAASH